MTDVRGRWVAVVTGTPTVRRASHYRGLPPGAGGDGERTLMGWPVVLVLEEETTGSAMLYRFAVDGEFAGDTWHQDLAAAKGQAEFE